MVSCPTRQAPLVGPERVLLGAFSCLGEIEVPLKDVLFVTASLVPLLIWESIVKADMHSIGICI